MMGYRIEKLDYQRSEENIDNPYSTVATGIETLQNARLFCRKYAKQQYGAGGGDIFHTGLDMPPETFQVITDDHYFDLRIIEEIE